MKVTYKILRFDPEKDKKPYFKDYDVEVEPTDRILDGLNIIKWYQDSTLSYRRSCAHGICGSDAMEINGVNKLACKVLIQNVGSHITIKPIRGLRVIKDLIVDMEPFFEKYRSIKPYLINDDSLPTHERLQSVEDREIFDDTTKCILCASCTSSCPSFWWNSMYLGPSALVQAHRFIFDSRDHGADERLEIVNDLNGIWRCRTIFNCVDACPREIKITKAIEELKRALLHKHL
ncbi:MAG: succinate dehydrogenase iron-sulfur subunit [Candidatus Fischerbacteria bacterium RBG_13_37_8]|uniref:succinate dehydrogenase n=1 Tax=Candidatus Fischerbacteria bacterium RBG_13_37_8 TaxID=1817863 RepID=A0A1F5VW41_9BACT|nr:MAG: succinate dehydrogenase iron-sulfur subunit [Candidatus Fischerbacteria bacterium RBG_13_37_8]